MCHLRHTLKFFLFHRKVIFCSQDIQALYFNHSMIYQICDVMMIISTWDRVHFEIYLLNHKSLTLHAWSIDGYNQGQYFCDIFWTNWMTGAKFQALFNLATSSNYSITNYVKFSVFHFFFFFFERVNKEELKMVNNY